MKVIGVVGSPRRGGNTELLVREALKVIEEEGLETELVTLWDKEIKPCDGCRACRRTLECHIKDDLPPIFEKILQAEGLILSSPVYFGSATPQIKAVIDRVGYVCRFRGQPLARKVGGPIVVARRAGHNFTLAQLLYFFFIMGMIIPGSTYWTITFGRRQGEALQDEEGVEAVHNFAKNMAWLIKKMAAEAPDPQ